MKIAFVVQRYGATVMGGAESHCRMLAEHLVTRGYDCAAYTTTAEDYVTWAPGYPEGESVLNGVTVKRYDVDEPRDIEAFNRYSEWFFTHAHDEDDEREWLARQGPRSPALIWAIERDAAAYDWWIFFTYLYYTTYWGLKAVPGKSVLVPTAHDESPLSLTIMHEVFGRPTAFMFNTTAERDMLARRFSFAGKYQAIAGAGVDVPVNPAAAPIAVKYLGFAPYVLYAGRIEPGKGCAELFENFSRVSAAHPDLRLLLAGELLMPLPDDPRVHYLGFVSPEERNTAMALAVATIHPSRFESLCMAALESLAVQTPILVQGATGPLRQHCLQGTAGLLYTNSEEFSAALDWLLQDRRLREALGRNGLDYVRTHYTWQRILDEYERLFTNS